MIIAVLDGIFYEYIKETYTFYICCSSKFQKKIQLKHEKLHLKKQNITVTFDAWLDYTVSVQSYLIIKL